MSTIKQKIRLVYLPFIKISIAFMAGYTYLHWLLLIKNNVGDISEEVANIWITLIIAAVVLLTLIRPKVKLLYLKTKRGNWLPIYLVAAGAAMAVPAIIAQGYLLTATGKLTTLNSVNEIAKQPPTKFYTLTSHYIYKPGRQVKSMYTISGKSNQYRDRDIYIVCPILDGDEAPTLIGSLNPNATYQPATKPMGPAYIIDGRFADSAKAGAIREDSIVSREVLDSMVARVEFGEAGANGAVVIKTIQPFPEIIEAPIGRQIIPRAWLGMHYSETVSNRGSQAELAASANAFYKRSLDSFDHANLEAFTYLDRIGNNDTRAGYIRAIKTIQVVRANAIPMILEPRFNAFAKRNGNKLAWVFGSYLIGAFVWLLMVLAARLKEPVEK